MNLLLTMHAYRREASWAVWELDGAGGLTGSMPFPVDQAGLVIHGRAMFVSLNPGSDGVYEVAENTAGWANFHNPTPKHNDIFLANALVGTPVWGAYMTDLHPGIPESDSRLVRSKPAEIELAVRSLIQQARLLSTVESIICVGSASFHSVAKHLALIEQEVGLPAEAVKKIPHYSRSNAGVHGQDPERYRALVHESLGFS